MVSPESAAIVEVPTPWQLLALSDAQLEQADVVVMNLSVARGIPRLESLDVAKYVRIVDEWTAQFRRELRGMERQFKATPWKWKNDIHFFRVGMLQGFLGHVIGIRYIEEQLNAKEAYYTDPGQLFLHGVIDTKQGTCGNMAALHVAMSRRMGWPVGLACVASHYISRYDDGKVIHNIEATNTHLGSFCSDSDDVYIEKFKIPKRAIECSSDLRKLTAREMMAMFFTSRGRYFRDTGRIRSAEVDYLLSRVLFPNHRRTYLVTMVPVIDRGGAIFDRGELGHPDSLFEDLAPTYAPNLWRSTKIGPPPGKMTGPQPPPFIYRDMYLPMPRLPQPNHNGKEIRR